MLVVLRLKRRWAVPGNESYDQIINYYDVKKDEIQIAKKTSNPYLRFF